MCRTPRGSDLLAGKRFATWSLAGVQEWLLPLCFSAICIATHCLSAPRRPDTYQLEFVLLCHERHLEAAHPEPRLSQVTSAPVEQPEGPKQKSDLSLQSPFLPSDPLDAGSDSSVESAFSQGLSFPLCKLSVGILVLLNITSWSCFVRGVPVLSRSAAT